MAVKSKEEILEAVKKYVGEDVSDEALGFIEDLTDTLDDREDPEEWKRKYEENDADWRRRYKERFFGSGETVTEDEDDVTEIVETEEIKTKFEELFEEVKYCCVKS